MLTAGRAPHSPTVAINALPGGDAVFMDEPRPASHHS